MKDEEYGFIEASCIGHLIDYRSELPYIWKWPAKF